MFAELYYIGTFDMPARPSEYHQNDDVAETVAEIPFVASTEIGDRAVQNSSIVPGYCPVVRFFLLHLRCDWTYTRQSNVYGQVASFFNVTNWLSPLNLRKIYNLTKFFEHLFCWKSTK